MNLYDLTTLKNNLADMKSCGIKTTISIEDAIELCEKIVTEEVEESNEYLRKHTKNSIDELKKNNVKKINSSLDDLKVMADEQSRLNKEVYELKMELSLQKCRMQSIREIVIVQGKKLTVNKFNNILDGR